MRTRSRLALLVSLYVTASSAAAQAQRPVPPAARAPATPFGLRMGMTGAEVKALGVDQRQSEHEWFLSRVPSPDPRFVDVLVTVGPRAGLCKLVAITPVIVTAESGRTLRTRYRDILEGLEQRYGVPYRSFDFVKQGSPWQSDGDFMIGLQTEDRALSSHWMIDKGSALPSNLEMISLEARATSVLEGYIGLKYYFANTTACEAEIKAARKNVF